MTARRAYPFSQTVAGETAHGILFANEAERDEALRIVLDGAACEARHQRAHPAIEPAEREPRPPGRPSFNGTLEEACAALVPTLARCPTAGARVTRVMQWLAVRVSANQLPKRSTVAEFLRHAMSVNSSVKLSENSSRGKRPHHAQQTSRKVERTERRRDRAGAGASGARRRGERRPARA